MKLEGKFKCEFCNKEQAIKNARFHGKKICRICWRKIKQGEEI